MTRKRKSNVFETDDKKSELVRAARRSIGRCLVIAKCYTSRSKVTIDSAVSHMCCSSLGSPS